MENLSQEDTQRLQALFEMATDGIITMGPDGIIENVNRAACTLFGYMAAEMRGQKVNMLMGKHDRTHHDEYLERYHKTGNPHIIGIGREVIGRRKDGTEFPLRLAVSEVSLPDKTIYTGILHDVSAFREAQRRVEELNAELEAKVSARTIALREREAELQKALGKERELNELKSRFLSMASHEFKTPLSTILSSAQIIDLYEEQSPLPQRKKHVQRIERAVSQLSQVLDDFLSLSQIEQGEVSAKKRSVNLNALVSTSIEGAEGQLKRDQEVETILPAEQQQIETDPKLLRHIILNLVSNAAKYSEIGQTVRVTVTVEGGRCRIEVADQGIGIPAAEQQYLFERFFRASNVENIKGTGLGLNIVSHYAALIGADLYFTSKEGEGSTFTLELPL